MTPEEIDQIVRDEEALWQEAYDAVFRELKRTESDFKNDRTVARDLTSQLVALRRDEEKMLLLNDERVSHSLSVIRKEKALSLDTLLDQPYFARVVCQEDDRTFEFRLSTASFPASRIVDWRESPLATLYYHYKEGDPYCEEVNDRVREGKIVIRRSFKGKGRELLAIELPDFVLSKSGIAENAAWTCIEKPKQRGPIAVSGAPLRRSGDGALQAARSRDGLSGGQLPPILSLLTPDQFALITGAIDRPLLIQGSAGSGKTTVALHRLAWLLHHKNSDALPHRTFVVVPSPSLKRYIAWVLPELGIEGVPIDLFDAWADRVLKPLTGPRRRRPLPSDGEVPAFKSSPELLQAIRDFVVADTQQVLTSFSKSVLTWGREAQTHFEREVATRLKPPPGQIFGEPVLRVIEAAKHSAKKAGLPSGGLTGYLSGLDALSRRLGNFVQDLFKVYQTPQLLERIMKAAYAARPVVFRRIEASLCAQVKALVFDAEDDALLLYIAYLKRGTYQADVDDDAALFDHIVIDEAQDFSFPQLLVLFKAVRAQHEITMVGDIAQQVTTHGSFPSWEAMLERLGVREKTPLALSVAYRTTVPIMQLAVHVRGTREGEEAAMTTPRMGPVPTYTACETARDLLDQASAWIHARTHEAPQALSAILCRFPDQATALANDLRQMGHGNVRLGKGDDFDFSPGVIVTSVAQAKGLEFRHVLLVNPSERAYTPDRPENRNLLYVGVTRAEDRLDCVGYEAPSSFFPTWLFEADEPEESDVLSKDENRASTDLDLESDEDGETSPD